PAEALGLQLVEQVEPEVQVGEPGQVGGPGGIDDRSIRAVLDQDDRGQHHLQRADEEVEHSRAAAGHQAERVQAVDQQHDTDEEKSDVAHGQLASRLMNVSDEITGAKNWLMRWNVAGSCSGRLQPVASPITIGSRPLS